MKTSIGFALGALLSLGAASAAETSVDARVQVPDEGIEVIVVTAKRPAAQSVYAEPIEVIVVTAKRAGKAAERTPPAMTIEMPKLELAVVEPPVFRL